MTIALFAAVTVAALLVTMARVVPFKIILGYATAIDILFSVIMLAFFSGSVTGAFSAVLAGLMLAVFLTVSRKLFGYQRMNFVKASMFTYKVGIVDTPSIWATHGEYLAGKFKDFGWTITPKVHAGWFTK